MDPLAPAPNPNAAYATRSDRPPFERIGLTITEHASHLHDAAVEEFARLAALLSETVGAEVVARHYLEPDFDVEAMVLSGSYAPWAAHDPADLDRLGEHVLAYDGPVLGICGGMQLLTRFAGGRIAPLPPGTDEHGWLPVQIVEPTGLFDGLGERAIIRQHHTWEVVDLPAEFDLLATSPASRVQAIASRHRPWWGTQFHPEFHDAEHPAGRQIIRSFAREAARARRAAARALR